MKIRFAFIVSFVVVLLAIALARAEEKSDAGFVSIFDGKTLSGWDGDPKFWSVRDGAITGETTKEKSPKHNTFIFWKDEVGDFELHLKCREVDGNSGIQYRSKRSADWVASGYQCDMGPGKNHNGKLYDERGKRGYICTAGQKVTISADGKKEVVSTDAAVPKFADGLDDKEWHDYVIIARGHHLQHLIDGHLIVDCTDEDKEHAALTGVLGFQIHAGHVMTVQFKDIEMKKLD
jgi:hypothetical protein